MTSGDPRSLRVARAWVRLYTRGLPPEVGEQRRLELESDMWEQLHHDPLEQHAARALLGRAVRGSPADVRWRYRTLLEQRGARQRSHNMEPTLAILGIVSAALSAEVGLAYLIAAVGDRSAPAGILALVVLACAGALVLGFCIRSTRRVASTTLLCVGAAGPALAMFWLPPIYLVSVAIIVLALATTPRRKPALDAER